MPRLTTIDDLCSPDWTSLLPHVQGLGTWFDDLKRNETSDIRYTVFIPTEKTRAPGVHASEVSGCFRKFVYAVSGTERKILPWQVNVNMKRRFGIGHAVHALTQNELGRAVMLFGGGYVDFVDEVSITPANNSFTQQYTVYSHADGLFTFFDAYFAPFLRVGLEIKTESGPEYEKLKEPRPGHILQAHVYMRALDLPLMWFLYYNKSNSNWTPPKAPWLITYDHRVERHVETRICNAYEAVRVSTLPQAEEGIYCSWCPFAYTCKPSCLMNLMNSSGSRPPSAFSTHR